MRVSLICCPFRTSFGAYGSSLKSALEARSGCQVQWVASNCGCGDPMESGRQFQTTECDYFEMPMPMGFRSEKLLNRKVRGTARSVLVHLRAKRYAAMVRDPEVVHFQQVLNGYGSKALFSWLKQPSRAPRVVTVHELDDDQIDSPKTNLTYNRADAIIVHCEEMKERLIQLKVQREKIHVVLHGTEIPKAPEKNSRDGIVFYAGHKLMSGKGIETVFKAMSMIRDQKPGKLPKLNIHGHYGDATPPDAIQLAEKYELGGDILWLNQIPEDQVVRLYQESLLCVLPYTGSFAGLAASVAAACQLPVVCTRKAGLPDHLGNAGIWIDENNAEQLAARIMELIDSEAWRKDVGARLLRRAQQALSWEQIAEQTFSIYQSAIERKAPRVDAASKELAGAAV